MKTAIVNLGPIPSSDWREPYDAILMEAGKIAEVGSLSPQALAACDVVLLGRLPRAVVRPPLMQIPAAEIERIRQALVAAGLLAEGAATKKQASLV